MSEPIARTVNDFCRAYGISRRAAYRLIEAGKLMAVKYGTRTLIPESSAMEWLKNLPPADSTLTRIQENKRNLNDPVDLNQGNI